MSQTNTHEGGGGIVTHWGKAGVGPNFILRFASHETANLVYHARPRSTPFVSPRLASLSLLLIAVIPAVQPQKRSEAKTALTLTRIRMLTLSDDDK